MQPRCQAAASLAAHGVVHVEQQRHGEQQARQQALAEKEKRQKEEQEKAEAKNKFSC